MLESFILWCVENPGELLVLLILLVIALESFYAYLGLYQPASPDPAAELVERLGLRPTDPSELSRQKYSPGRRVRGDQRG